MRLYDFGTLVLATILAMYLYGAYTVGKDICQRTENPTKTEEVR